MYVGPLRPHSRRAKPRLALRRTYAMLAPQSHRAAAQTDLLADLSSHHAEAQLDRRRTRGCLPVLSCCYPKTPSFTPLSTFSSPFEPVHLPCPSPLQTFTPITLTTLITSSHV